ncbi:hypothetical protein [Aurantiacibacter sp. D1-12]|uniref:hypothetical protein n=1 Tax=Aurantiacibacter sp. D1-12 TaxID=2993658 RepID=UPI00237CA994|nr:hypothetical protein [Aurantiacibacter sp. D1-12]MDE1467428.1 hypothetical protein [Aurantiacibacter sp. D1-12]
MGDIAIPVWNRRNVIDIFSILLTHGLILVAAWRLLAREDLDRNSGDEAPPPPPWLKNHEGPHGGDADA